MGYPETRLFKHVEKSVLCEDVISLSSSSELIYSDSSFQSFSFSEEDSVDSNVKRVIKIPNFLGRSSRTKKLTSRY